MQTLPWACPAVAWARGRGDGQGKVSGLPGAWWDGTPRQHWGETCTEEGHGSRGTGLLQYSRWGLGLEQEERAPELVVRVEGPRASVSSQVATMMGHFPVPQKEVGGCEESPAGWRSEGQEHVWGSPLPDSPKRRDWGPTPWAGAAGGPGSPRGNAAPGGQSVCLASAASPSPRSASPPSAMSSASPSVSHPPPQLPPPLSPSSCLGPGCPQ